MLSQPQGISWAESSRVQNMEEVTGRDTGNMEVQLGYAGGGGGYDNFLGIRVLLAIGVGAGIW